MREESEGVSREVLLYYVIRKLVVLESFIIVGGLGFLRISSF